MESLNKDHPHLSVDFLVTDKMLEGPCAQERYGVSSICFGCGPAQPLGLKVRTFEVLGQSESGFVTVAKWHPEPHHAAFPGMLNGGIIGAILDCHSNWTAALALRQRLNLESAPCTVTSSFKITLLKPTPSQGVVTLRAVPHSIEKDRFVVIHATLEAGGVITATCEGLFVAVKEGHPAYHRW